MLTQVSLYSETICSHPFAERAKGRYCVYARVVTLFALQAAHLRDERLSSADFHAVNYVRNFHRKIENSMRRIELSPKPLSQDLRALRSMRRPHLNGSVRGGLPAFD
jgi:hypothetical protein